MPAIVFTAAVIVPSSIWARPKSHYSHVDACEKVAVVGKVIELVTKKAPSDRREPRQLGGLSAASHDMRASAIGVIVAGMLPLRARVTNGRLVMDEPTTLPEGTEIELAPVEDDLDDADRARLHDALDAADDELRAGKGIPGEQLIAALRRGEL